VQLVVIQNVIAFWDPDTTLSPVWIILFLTTIVIFNLLNVRNLGEIEFWLALTKLQGILVITMFGLVLVLGASPGSRKLGTSPDNTTAIFCSATAQQSNSCLEAPGFNCNILSQVRKPNL
jgi:amino acid permease